MEVLHNPLHPASREKSAGPTKKIPTMKSSDRWGPFAPGLDVCELRARLRSLRAIVRLLLGRDGDAIDRMLHCAESGNANLDAVVAAINRLPTIPLRKILATYAALTRPADPCAA